MASLVGCMAQFFRLQKGTQPNDLSIPTSTRLPIAFQDVQLDSSEVSADKPEDPVNEIWLH